MSEVMAHTITLTCSTRPGASPLHAQHQDLLGRIPKKELPPNLNLTRRPYPASGSEPPEPRRLQRFPSTARQIL